MQQSAGVKYDKSKPKLSLLFLFGPALDALLAITEYGAQKYPDASNWQRVDDGEARYREAALRHLRSHCEGQEFDEESGKPHMYHFAWNAMASCWHYCNRKQERTG